MNERRGKSLRARIWRWIYGKIHTEEKLHLQRSLSRLDAVCASMEAETKRLERGNV